MYDAIAFSLSSATYAAMQLMMLSLTNAPTGSAFAMPSLYDDRSFSTLSNESSEKPSTPRPIRPAISYDAGLPAAYHIGACPLPYGRGRILRGGSDQYLPS